MLGTHALGRAVHHPHRNLFGSRRSAAYRWDSGVVSRLTGTYGMRRYLGYDGANGLHTYTRTMVTSARWSHVSDRLHRTPACQRVSWCRASLGQALLICVNPSHLDRLGKEP